MAYSALYLHIPFCRSKCLYCDFDSRALAGCDFDNAIGRYLGYLLGSLERHGVHGDLSGVQTVYAGGGTPTLLGKRLPDLVRAVLTYCRPVEFTCEANPESYTPDLAKDLADAGVTRISLGVQSLSDVELTSIGRIHSARQALDAIALSKGCGLSTSCDLMCGLPGQTIQSWQRTLDAIISADPDHVSVYPLQLEEGTPLARLEETGQVAVPDDDFQATCMEMASSVLAQAGYDRYEVASYAKPGHRCRHNIAYWTGKPYLGLGRSAASMKMVQLGTYPNCTISRERFTQLDDAGEKFDRELLTAREALAEDLMLACRMTDGIPAELLDRAAEQIPVKEIGRACESAVGRGLACWDGGRLKPTRTGWLEGNELFGLFWGLAAE